MLQSIIEKIERCSKKRKRTLTMNERLTNKHPKLSSRIAGKEKLDEIRMNLALYDTKVSSRSEDQIIVSEKILKSIAPIIYGPCYDEERSDILLEQGWDDNHALLVVHMPRREGKSESIAITLACVMWTCPVNISLFAPNSSQGNKETGSMKIIHKVLLDLFPSIEFTVCNKSQIEFKRDGQVSRAEFSSA